MPTDSRWYLVCYDIRHAKRLRKVAKHLEGYGMRLQYSVFRCHLSRSQMQKLRWELTERIVTKEDDVLFIPLCDRCVAGLAVTHDTAKKPNWPGTPPACKIV